MKAIILFAVAATLSHAGIAQVDSVRLKKLSASPKQAALANPNLTIKATTNLPVKAAAIGREPDLAISTFSVKKLSDVVNNGEVSHKLEISCTIKNTGSVAIAGKNISLDGQISFDPQHTTGIAGCGTVLSTLASDVVKPGDSFGRTYYCTVKYDATHAAYYNLKVTAYGVSETNMQNNVAQASIPF